MKEPKKLVWPDYENCIANLPNSILKKWKISTSGETLMHIPEKLRIRSRRTERHSA